MEVTLISLPLNLHVLWFAFIVSCQAVSDCPWGQYYDSNYRRCRKCSLCPSRDVILGTSQSYGTMADCNRYDSLCPYWCSVETAGSNLDGVRDACPPTTPSPPVPFVNVTIDGPQYNETANSYTAACTMFFSNMDTPTLEWSNPSGQPLESTDTLGKWKVTQEVMSATLLVNDFQKGDEGNYSCSAHGEQNANQTIFLEYDEPPTTTSPPTTSPMTTPQGPGISELPNTAKSATPEGGISTVIVAAIFGGVALLVVLCAALAYVCLRRRNRSAPRSRVADFESLPLTDPNIVDRLALRTSDFVSANIVGIQTCLDQPNCAAVIIKKRNKTIGTVHSSQDEFYIEHIAWDDSIEVWMKYRQRRKIKLIKVLKMNCLKIGNVTETSAVITCPSVANTFYLHYEEKNAQGGSSQVGQVELMQGGSKEIRNLRPSIAYCVQLGIKGHTGDSGAYNWVWKDEFSTKCISFQPVIASDSSVKLTLTGHSDPRSLQLYCAINGSKPKQMTSTEIQFSSLISGMDQVLQVKEKIGGSDGYRLLQEIPFKTTGSVQLEGDYRDYATTDGPFSDVDQVSVSSNVRRKFPKRKTVPLTCDTGLLEAIDNLRDNPSRYKNVYARAEQSVVKAVLDSLVDFLKDSKDTTPNVLPDVSTSRRMKGMDLVEEFIKHLNMVNYTGVFDLLRRFIEKEEVHTQAGVCFAEQLLDAHSPENGTCHVCKHAVYILKWYKKKRDNCQSAVC